MQSPCLLILWSFLNYRVSYEVLQHRTAHTYNYAENSHYDIKTDALLGKSHEIG